jgi:hypothetical protein
MLFKSFSRNLEVRGLGLIGAAVLSQHMLRVSEENLEQNKGQGKSDPAEIQSEFAPNTSFERYRYTGMLRDAVQCGST